MHIIASLCDFCCYGSIKATNIKHSFARPNQFLCYLNAAFRLKTSV